MGINAGISVLANHRALAHVPLALGVWQDSGGGDNEHLLTIFVGIAAFSLLLQALMLVGVGIGAFVALKKVMAEVDDIKGKVMPLVGKGQALVEQVQGTVTSLTPTIHNITGKVEVITGHVEEISAIAKDKVVEFGPTLSKANETLLSANETVMDATTKTHEQLLRVNEMISASLDATERATKSALHTITQPGREIAGVATGVKVALKTLFEKGPGAREKARGPVSAAGARPFAAESYPAYAASKTETLVPPVGETDLGL